MPSCYVWYSTDFLLIDVYLFQLLSKLNNFQNKHSSVFFVKVITLSKVPLLKICLILQTNIFFYIFLLYRFFLPALPQNRIQVYNGNKQKASCLFICGEAFIKKFQRLFREYRSQSFSSSTCISHNQFVYGP